jgi:hypothetical protein
LELALNKSKVFPDKEIIFGGTDTGICNGGRQNFVALSVKTL